MTAFRASFALFSGILLLTGCGGNVSDGPTSDRSNTVTRLFQSAPGIASNPAPRIDAFWQVVEAPATVLDAGGTGSTAGSFRIGGRAVMQTANHIVPARYKVAWSGARTGDAADPTRIVLRDAAGHEALELRFEGTRLRVITQTEDSYPQLHFRPGIAHRVSLILDMTTEPTVAVDITQGGLPLFTSPPLPVKHGAFRGLHQLDVDVSSDAAAYHIAGVVVEPVQ